MLKEKRDEIDMIDNELMRLLDKRLNIVKEVGEYKKDNDIQVLDNNREKEILNKIEKYENQKEITEIYIYIMNKSKDIQNG